MGNDLTMQRQCALRNSNQIVETVIVRKGSACRDTWMASLADFQMRVVDPMDKRIKLRPLEPVYGVIGIGDSSFNLGRGCCFAGPFRELEDVFARGCWESG
jgi:hypothetical protein